MKKLSLFLFLILASCSTLPSVHTVTQQRIVEKTEKLTDDAKDFIATAKHLLDDVKVDDPKLKQAIDMIQKSQVLLGSKLDDGEKLKSLTLDQLKQATDTIYNQDQKIKDLIEKLESKDKITTDKLVVQQAIDDAIKRHDFWGSFKLYTILGTVSLAIIALFVYVPSSGIRGVSGLLGVFKRNEPEQRP